MDLKFSSVAATPSNPNWNNLISRKDELYKKKTMYVLNSKEIMIELYIVMLIED